MAKPAEVQEVFVVWHPRSGNQGAVNPDAIARLVRSDGGISFHLRTVELAPGHRYALWLMVIDNPGACDTSPCAAEEILLRPSARAQVTHVRSRVATRSAHVSFAGRIPTGRVAGSLANRTMANPRGAEVHLVVTEDGPISADPGPTSTSCRFWQTAVFGGNAQSSTPLRQPHQ